MANKVYSMARLGRIAASLAVLAGITVAVAMGYDTWLSRMQIIPALLACTGVWLALWAAVTALAGRVYCSSVCPMGTLQDLFIAVSRRRRRGFFYRVPRTGLRWCVAAATGIAAVLGLSVVVSAVDPYSAYARMVTCLALPAVKAAAVSLTAAATAAATLALVAWISLTRGRELCNTICPVGTLLGALARYSLYHVDIDTDKCTGCGLCVSKCKAGCIHPSDHTVDLSRCVVCLDCLTDCPNSAITFRKGRHRLKMPMMEALGGAGPTACQRTNEAVRPVSRRKFLASVLAGGAALAAPAAVKAPKPLNRAVPPGVKSREDYEGRCTACGACVAACPTQVLRTSDHELGWRHAMQPVMDFDQGACLYDCTRCTQVCPTGALAPLTPGEKHRFVIGKARLEADLCLMYATGEDCGLCARRCPAGAIAIEVAENGRRVPTVDFDRCTGCGMCQWVCPARPRAFVIEGE